MVTSAKVIVGEASQSSVAVAAGKVGVAGHSIGDTTVGQVRTGGVISAAIKVWTQVSVSVPSVIKYVRTTTNGSPIHPMPEMASLAVIVTGPHESITVIKAGFGAGISSTQLKEPPSSGGQLTSSLQQSASAQESNGLQSGASVRDTLTQY